ncbi:MAG: hypothetical protein OXJ90_12475 [Spirochaetaceae bacterium]|nr:hypothetical protein [Spirochaetaceae bacterium]
MRSDMSKVIVERPRSGGRGLRKGRRPRDPDDFRKQVGLHRAAVEADSWKELNENLAPLRRYLHSQVGRPWDKVWSEICANLRPSSAVQQHVRDHVFDFVARDVTVRDGEFYLAGRFLRPATTLRESWYELWIDPRTGILRRNRHYRTYRQRSRERQRRREALVRRRMVSAGENRQYHLLQDGAWWEVALKKVPTYYQDRRTRYGPTRRVAVEREVHDAVLDANLSDLPRAVLYDRRGVYAASKRQLSKKETKRLGLR